MSGTAQSNKSINYRSAGRFIKPVYIVPIFSLIIIVFYLYSRSMFMVNVFTYHYLTMDTVVELRFECAGKIAAEKIRDNVFSEIERLELLFSRSIDDSAVSKINRQAGLAPVTVSPEVLHVVEQSIYYAHLSNGAFDPTIAPVTDLWGFLTVDNDSPEYRVPSPGELEKALLLVDYKLIEIDRDRSTVYLPQKGMSLELGGIAKGYIIDQAMRVLAESGVTSAYINAGGDIGLLGNRFDGDPWRIGIGNPREGLYLIAVITVSDKAVLTSGDYERFFQENDDYYHHILDPYTGMPAKSLASVTIVAGNALEADALSTAIFVLGPDRGMVLIESIPGVEGILITKDLTILVSSGLKDNFELR